MHVPLPMFANTQNFHMSCCNSDKSAVPAPAGSSSDLSGAFCIGVALLAVQVLNALAPCQQEQGDMSGADAMLKSSFTLSKNLQDLHSQVGALWSPTPDQMIRCTLAFSLQKDVVLPLIRSLKAPILLCNDPQDLDSQMGCTCVSCSRRCMFAGCASEILHVKRVAADCMSQRCAES